VCHNHVVITGRQVRAAKAMLRLSTRELAALAQVFTLRKIQGALEGAGIEFGADGVTVRLRARP
jgi:hypothetical protein